MKYSEKEIEEILKKYKLTEEEHEKYYHGQQSNIQ